MIQFFKKLLLGKVSLKDKPKIDPIQKRLLNIKSIWNNDHQDDNGIEKNQQEFGHKKRIKP